jgi:hypothetical protein
VFLKDREIIFINDAWLLTFDIDMSAYEEAITDVKADILSLEVYRKEAVSNFELNQIKTLMDTLEVRLHSFQRLLPKYDCRRGLINLGGNILKLSLELLPWPIYTHSMTRLIVYKVVHLTLFIH